MPKYRPWSLSNPQAVRSAPFLHRGNALTHSIVSYTQTERKLGPLERGGTLSGSQAAGKVRHVIGDAACSPHTASF